MISGDVESNPGPVAHGTSTHTAHTILRNPSIALLLCRLAQKGLKTVTRKYLRWFMLLFFNDLSYQMNVHAAGVESIIWCPQISKGFLFLDG